jgi:hypothetical protein
LSREVAFGEDIVKRRLPVSKGFTTNRDVIFSQPISASEAEQMYGVPVCLSVEVLGAPEVPKPDP